MAVTRIADGVYLIRDTCNVYALVCDREATLIDFGDGAVFDHLDELGADRITDVLITHHHRNPLAGEETVTVRLVVPDGWRCDPREATARVGGRTHTTFEFEVYPPAGEHVRRARVGADLTVGPCRFGQQAEALVDVT